MESIGDVSKLLIFTIKILSFLPLASAYYCDHDLCGNDQYCCGDNLCCEYVYSIWYFWVGVVFLILVLSACGGFFRYCYDNKSYVILHTCRNDFYPSKNSMEEAKILSTVIEDVEAPPPYPGNQYSDSMQTDYQGFPSAFSCASYEHPSHHKNMSRPACR